VSSSMFANFTNWKTHMHTGNSNYKIFTKS